MPSTGNVLGLGTSALALMIAAVRPAVAQPPTPSGQAGLAFELRLGTLWPQAPLILDRDDRDPSTSSFAIGGRFGYDFAEPLGGRLGLHLIGDYAALGSAEYREAAPGLVRREGHWFVFTPALSIDLLKTSRLVASARAGPSVVGELTTFLLERSDPSCTYYSPGVYSCEGEFDNVCDLTAFEDRCSEHYRGALSLGGGIRWHPHRTWPLYFGIDYSWLSPDQYVLVATIGLWTRYRRTADSDP
jgi:hypothetical protein